MSDYKNHPLIIGIDARITLAEAEAEKSRAQLAEVEAAGADLAVFTEENQREYQSFAYRANKGDKGAIATRAKLAGELSAAQPDIDQAKADQEAARATATEKAAAVKAARADRAKALYYLAENEYAQGWIGIINLMRATDEARAKTDTAQTARAEAITAGKEFGLTFWNPSITGTPAQVLSQAMALIGKGNAILKEIEAA